MLEKLALSSCSSMEPSIFFDNGKQLVKTASNLLPEIEKYAEGIVSSPKYTWVLVHAIGAFEAYGCNNNADATSIEALNNVPKGWTGEPSIDRIIAKECVYGWPTYYNAHVFANHQNKNPLKSIGSVEFICWNPDMLRVELVLKIDKDKAKEFGGEWAINRMDNSTLVDVSMGMRVPFDLSNREVDWDKYNRAVSTFTQGTHLTPGHAVLAFHKKDPIPGLSITRNDYTSEVKLNMRKVYPDGSQTFVWNTYPRFFDLSMVFVGAERPAKIMHKFASQCKISGVKCASCRGKKCTNKITPPGAYLNEIMETEMPKLASVDKKALERKVGRLVKSSEIEKETPSSFEDSSVAAMADREEDLPKDILDRLGKSSLPEALSTPTLLGMKLKPKEFQRIVLVHMGKKDTADTLDNEGKVFKEGIDAPSTSPCINHESFSPMLAKLLAPLMGMRSGFSPALRGRITIIVKRSAPEPAKEERTGLLDKISSVYTAYKRDLYNNFEKEANLVFHQNLLVRDALFGSGMLKEGSSIIDSFTREYMGSRK